MGIRFIAILTLLIIGTLCSKTIHENPTQGLKNAQRRPAKNRNNAGPSSWRIRRQSEDNWIEKDFKDHDNLSNVQALVIRDENVPPCGSPADKITNQRYFICSGAVISERHVITSASCVHLAYVYEHHLEADLAVMIGATSATSFVIKVSHHEIHPSYNFDLDSKDHPTHNVALLYLACPIPCMTSVPRLPANPNENVAHMCCPDRCETLTILLRANNRHVARVLKAKHVPSPTHEQSNDGNTSYGQSRASRYEKFNGTTKDPIQKRVVRGLRLASPPVFYAKDTGRAATKQNSRTNGDTKGLKPRKSGRKSAGTEEPKAEKSKDPKGTIGDTPKTNLSNDERSKIDFAKTIVDAVFQRINDTIADIDPDRGSGKIVDVITKNASLDDIVDVIVKPIVSAVSVQLNKTLGEQRGHQRLPDRYQDCPPLGSPVMMGDTLVALVAYTCDDVQSWVEWKYVNINRNIEWINDRLSATDQRHEEQSSQVKNKLSNDQLDDYKNNISGNNCCAKNVGYHCATRTYGNNNAK